MTPHISGTDSFNMAERRLVRYENFPSTLYVRDFVHYCTDLFHKRD